MIYRDFQGLKLSALGFGAMRLPVLNGDDSRIDEAAALRMVDTAMQNGINYYDTAWGYHGENSETVMGKALARYPRDSFYVATKFPGYDASNWSKVKEIFPRQMEKLGVDYFDFYLFHNVCEMNIDAYLEWGAGCAQTIPGRLWQGHGILSAAAQLSGLDIPARQGEGRIAPAVGHSGLGDGAPARRQAGKASAGA